MQTYNNKMCRICLQEHKDDFESVFANKMDNELSQLGLLYDELFNLSIQFDEHHPEYLCNYCNLQLKLFHKFKTKAVESHAKFSAFAEIVKEEYSILELSNDETDMKFELDESNDDTLQSALICEDAKTCSAVEVGGEVIMPCAREDEEFEEVQYLEDGENESESLSELEQDRNADAEKETREFPCKNCDKVFERKAHLAKHRKDLHKVVKYTCTMCPKKFISKELLQGHLNIHNGLPGFQCNLCDKTFKQKAHFVYHIQGHRNERNSQCHLCVKRFLNNSDLRIHLRVHSDERRYECDVCGRKFRAHTHMTNHRYTHFGKTIECELCQQKYSTPATLKTHIKSVHRGECPYTCLVCSKRFKRRHHLKSHQKIHLPKNPSR